MKRILPLLIGSLLLCWTGQVASQAATKAAPKSQPAAAAKPAKTGIAQDPYIGAIAIDAASGRVLFADKAEAPGYPASVLKLMDLLIILEKIQQKQLSFQDIVPVSAKSAKTGGSQVYLAQGESFTVDEMLYALMVQSANDAAVALAEKVAGSTEAFVVLMNQRARQLGMNNTIFHSVHGLPPGAGQSPDVTTARDFAILCRELLRYPDTLRYTSTREHNFRANVPGKNIMMRTHNHVMTSVAGCDGLKTGYFTLAGFSIAVSAARNNQRVIVVVLGSRDRLVRDAKAAEWVEKAFAAMTASAPAPARAVNPAPVAKPAVVMPQPALPLKPAAK